MTAPGAAQAARNRRSHGVRAATLKLQRMSQSERRHLRIIHPDAEKPYWRPKTRADCADVPRPCPYVGCKHNLYLDVSEKTGNVKVNFPDREPEDMPADRSCVLDITEAGPITLESLGDYINVTRERARQIENIALKKAELAAEPELEGATFEHPAGFFQQDTIDLGDSKTWWKGRRQLTRRDGPTKDEEE